MADERKYYVGISECGCVSALLVDDDRTTPREIGDFARRMAKTKRRMEHRTVTPQGDDALFVTCPHKVATP